MKIRSLLFAVLALALALPVAASSAAPGDSTATISKKKKKKKTWCQKQSESMEYRSIKQVKFKRIAKQDKQKAWLYQNNYKKDYLFCSEKPKFATTVAAWSGIKKTSHFNAVKNNCAVFYSEGDTKENSTGYGEKGLTVISYRFFRKGGVPQLQGHIYGKVADQVSMVKMQLTSHCMLATAFVKNGMPMIEYSGIGDFPSGSIVKKELPGATVADLKTLKVSSNKNGTAVVSLTVGGVPMTFNY